MSATTYNVIFQGDAFSVGDYRCAGHSSDSAENSSSYSLSFVRRGVFRVRRGSQSALLSPVHAFLVTPDHPFTVDHPVDGGDECTVFTFTERGWEMIEGELRGIFREVQAFAAAVGFLAQTRMLQRIVSGDGGVEEAGWAAIASFSAGAGAEPCSGPSSHVRRAVAVAEELLAAHFDEQLPLRAIAGHAGLSQFHLCRGFRQVTGVSMHRYQSLLRLRSAMQRLKQGADNLTRLALDLGFSDHSHFCRAFRREFGMQPSAFRSGASQGTSPAEGRSAKPGEGC
ncbi:MAG: AraC family transcriptional regulator [Acidobacteriota bacterium]